MLNVNPISSTSGSVQGTPTAPSNPISTAGTSFLLSEAANSRPAAEKAPVLGKGIADTMDSATSGAKEVFDSKTLAKAAEFQRILDQGLPLALQLFDEAKAAGINVPDPRPYYESGDPKVSASWLTDTAQRMSGQKAADALTGEDPDYTKAVAESLKGPEPKNLATTLDLLKPAAGAASATDKATIKQSDALLRKRLSDPSFNQDYLRSDEIDKEARNLGLTGTYMASPEYKALKEGFGSQFANEDDYQKTMAPIDKIAKDLQPATQGILRIDKTLKKHFGQGINDIDPAKLENFTKVLKAAMPVESANTSSGWAAVVNAAKNLAPDEVVDTLILDPNEKETLRIYREIQRNPELLKKIRSSEFQDLMTAMTGMMVGELKATSGAAVSSGEFSRYASKYGMGAFTSPAGLVSGLRNTAQDTYQGWKDLESGANSVALDKYKERRGGAWGSSALSDYANPANYKEYNYQSTDTGGSIPGKTDSGSASGGVPRPKAKTSKRF